MRYGFNCKIDKYDGSTVVVFVASSAAAAAAAAASAASDNRKADGRNWEISSDN